MHSLWLKYIYRESEYIYVCVYIYRERVSRVVILATLLNIYFHNSFCTNTQYCISVYVMYFSLRTHFLHYVDHCIGSGYLHHYEGVSQTSWLSNPQTLATAATESLTGFP